LPQITIYVPQDLANALDRQREGLNVSQVCAQALRMEIGMGEGVADATMGGDQQTPVDATQAIIERLRLQKQRSLEHADEVERARTRAEGWLKKAHYEQIKRFGELEPTADPERFYADTFRLMPRDEEMTREWGQQRTREGLGFSLPVYRRAWHEHVRGFWERVKDEI
jgi:hypothetical protein